MKLIIYILTLLLSTSCGSDENDQVIVDTDINVSIKNSDGVDLLDSANPHSYREDSIKLFYIKNGEEVEVFDADMDYPKGFFIYKHENEYRMRIFPNIDKSEEFPLTYIKWNETTIDTIKCIIERKSNSQICKKVWFNNESVWEAYETERFFEIIK